MVRSSARISSAESHRSRPLGSRSLATTARATAIPRSGVESGSPRVHPLHFYCCGAAFSWLATPQATSFLLTPHRSWAVHYDHGNNRASIALHEVRLAGSLISEGQTE